MPINKHKLEQEITKLLLNFKGADKEQLKIPLDKIMSAVSGENYDKSEISQMINDLLNILFKNPYIQEPLIPLSFIESELGHAIMCLKFKDISSAENTERVYTVKDVAQITNKTVQAIYKDINLHIHPIAPNNKTFYESEVKKYLQLKKIPLDNLYKFNGQK